LVLADDDQGLAAEPGFHRDAPQGGGTEVRSIRRLSEHRSEPLEPQPENDLALAWGLAQTSGDVVEDGAGDAALEAAQFLKQISRWRLVTSSPTRI